ncbi:MAG: CoA ester lyase [Alcaligenaceae bacterium]|nr:CoA ester lyase [Alcaligenaceae bacterium]
MRSLLFIPGHDERKLEKGLGCGADALILDLEDAVPMDGKARARDITAAFVGQHHAQHRLFVRINDLDSDMALQDLAAVVRAQPYGIMLPKCSGTDELVRVGAWLEALEVREGIAPGTIRILPIVTEHARAVLNMGEYTHSANSRLCGMLWGGEDLATDIGARSNQDAPDHYTDVFRLARSMTLLAAASARVTPVDAVYVNFRNPEGLRAEALDARRDGFTAKAAIHPDQVAVINEVFQPAEQELEWARRVVSAFAQSPGAGSIGLDGKMLDRPHLLAAQRLLDGMN